MELFVTLFYGRQSLANVTKNSMLDAAKVQDMSLTCKNIAT